MGQTLNWTNELKIEFFDLAYRKSGGTSICETFNEFILSKKPKPLFTTEDGVEIFENDKWYWVSAWNIHEQKGLLKSSKMYDSSCAFSTEEKAKDYILMNKPCLSVSDIYNILTVSKFQTSMASNWLLNKNEIEEKIKELAKQKINL